jgi:hypothetical protein
MTRPAAGALRRPHRFAVLFGSAVVLSWMLSVGWVVATGGSSAGTVLALFPPGLAADAALAAITQAGGRPISSTWFGVVWLVATDPGGAARLREAGAFAVLADPRFIPALGCVVIPTRPTARTLWSGVEPFR